MEIVHHFTIPVRVEQAWDVLLDVERIAPCLPGATLDNADEDGTYRGSVRVKVGPITVTYRGTARIVEADASRRTAVVEAAGKEARGSGTATATITSVLESEGDNGTSVSVNTELTVTGRPAQFGRGVMADVAGKLINRFADCLAEELAARPAPAVATAGAGTSTAAPDRMADSQVAEEAFGSAAFPSGPAPSAEPPRAAPPIDLVGVAGGPVARRLGPVVVLVAIVMAVRWWWRRRRR